MNLDNLKEEIMYFANYVFPSFSNKENGEIDYILEEFIKNMIQKSRTVDLNKPENSVIIGDVLSVDLYEGYPVVKVLLPKGE